MFTKDWMILPLLKEESFARHVIFEIHFDKTMFSPSLE